MWRRLLEASLDSKDLYIAECCAAVLQNVSLSNFISNLSGSTDRRINARLCELRGDHYGAESIYTTNGAEEAKALYEKVEMFSDALRVMKKIQDPNVNEKKRIYLQSFIESNRHEKAAEMIEEEGDLIQAVSLYLTAGFLEKAANLCLENRILEPEALMKDIAFNLESLCLYGIAAEMFKHISYFEESLECYIKGELFQNATAIAREHFSPGKLRNVQNRWIHHCIGKGRFQDAEEIYKENGNWFEAVQMYRNHDKWEDAIRLVVDSGDDEEVERISFDYAIRLGVACKKLDTKIMNFAISFCLKNNDYENAIVLARYSKSKEFVEKLVLKHNQILEEDELFQRSEAEYPLNEPDSSDEQVSIRKKDNGLEQVIYNDENDMQQPKIPDAQNIKHKPMDEFKRLSKMREETDSIFNVTSSLAPREFYDAKSEDVAKLKSEKVNITTMPGNVTADIASIEARFAMKPVEDSLSSKALPEKSVEVEKKVELSDFEHLDTISAVDKLLKNIVPSSGLSNSEIIVMMTAKILASNQTKGDFHALGAMENDINNIPSDYSIKRHLFYLVHYTKNMILLTNSGLYELACKCAISLLSYAIITLENGRSYTLIPAEKAFYQAGVLSRDSGFSSLAFLLLNHFIDIAEVSNLFFNNTLHVFPATSSAEIKNYIKPVSSPIYATQAIDENDGSFLSNEEFEDTTIPFTGHIATSHSISEIKREEIREWILDSCMDSEMEKKLLKPVSIEGGIYDGFYAFDAPQCIITGYPVAPDDIILQGEDVASKRDHDLFVNQVGESPWFRWARDKQAN